jgi:hypothetical protein
VITKILHKPVTIAHQVISGVARGGLHGAVALVRKFLPADQDTRTEEPSPRFSTEPVRQTPPPTTTTKKATTKRAAAKKTAAKKTAAKRTPKK